MHWQHPEVNYPTVHRHKNRQQTENVARTWHVLAYLYQGTVCFQVKLLFKVQCSNPVNISVHRDHADNTTIRNFLIFQEHSKMAPLLCNHEGKLENNSSGTTGEAHKSLARQ